MKTCHFHFAVILPFCFLLLAGVLAPGQVTNIIFSDNFESGTMSNWTATATTPSPLEPSTVRNIVPATGQFSAYMNTSADRMHHNLAASNGGVEVTGHSVATWWIYDPGATAPANRIFCEVRGYAGGTGLPNGSTTASGTLSQLLAAGKYNAVTLSGETWDSTKYQGRSILGVDGWFNLNAAGAPSRSAGWHRFDIERLSDNTTIKYYVDGILSRTITGTGNEGWDTAILGPGLGSTVGDAWIDGFAIASINDCSDPITIRCPSNIVVSCTNRLGVPVTFAVTATNARGSSVAVVCAPSSGSLFPVGLSRVVCTATGACNNVVTCDFLVEVEDTLPPQIICPTNMTVEGSSPGGAIVTWSVSATDDCSSNVTITCTPPSGSVFPVGVTAVNCVASDESGNQAVCAFLVRVLPPPPPQVSRGSGTNATNFLLRWRGNQALQHTASLDSGRAAWQDVTLGVTGQGDEHLATWPITDQTHFFRLRGLPFPPGRDSDGDGIPDTTDRCPNTKPGATVDACGCSTVDVVRRPEALLGPVRHSFSNAMLFVARIATHTNVSFSNVTFSAVQRYFDTARDHLASSSELLSEGNLCASYSNYLAALSDWASARTALADVVRQVGTEWSAQDHPSGYGDVSQDDAFVLDLDAALADFNSAQSTADSALPAVQSACGAVIGSGRLRGLVVDVNDSLRTITLEDGHTIVLRKGDFPGNFASGVIVDVSGTQLSDGSMIGTAVGGPVSASPGVAYPHTVLRLAPIQPFPPEGSGPYKLHTPEAYENPFGGIGLERGMRLAAASIGGFSQGQQSQDSLKIELSYETAAGGSKTLLVASALKPGDTPVDLPSFSDGALFGAENLIVTTQHKDPATNVLTILGTTNYPIRIGTRGGYCWANYDETEFELPEANQPGGVAVTFVSSTTVNSLLYGPVDPNTTAIFEYWNFGGTLRKNQDPFLIFNSFDPSGFDPGVYTNGLVYVQGVPYPSGITWPRIRGKRHGREFWYSVEVPRIVRDRMSACANGLPNSYYKLPFQGGWPTWVMGQGNMNPGFTHCPGCYNQYAFDLIAAQGTQILAARGGTILDLRESQFQNCFNSGTGKCGSCKANYLKILHQDGTVGVYMHMPQNSITLNIGDRVYRGSPVALVGNVGCSSTAHLHFQVDPYNGAPLSTQITFEALNVCHVGPTPIPCAFPNDIRDCYIPQTGDILFSNNP